MSKTSVGDESLYPLIQTASLPISKGMNFRKILIIQLGCGRMMGPIKDVKATSAQVIEFADAIIARLDEEVEGE